MEKQRNRGQDGAGMANIKLNTPPGKRYISRKRSTTENPIQDLFAQINKRFIDLEESNPKKLDDLARIEFQQQYFENGGDGGVNGANAQWNSFSTTAKQPFIDQVLDKAI